MKPLISIVIPAYNMERYLREAIDSVLAQTYENIEIIVVDDGSRDDIKKIVEAYVQREKVRYIFQENKGLAAARNTGVRMAKGTYIALLDADDIFLPMKIERQVSFLEAHPDCDVSYANLWHFRDEEPNKLLCLNYRYYSGKPVFRRLLQKNFINPLAVVFRRSVFERFGYFDEEIRQWAEDWDFWLHLSLHGATFCFINERLAKYRIRGHGSLSYDPHLEIQRRETALRVFLKLKKDMSCLEQVRFLLPWYLGKQRAKLFYARLSRRFRFCRRFHLWLQTRRLKQAS